MTETLTLRAYSKVNLFLHIIGRNENGYHRMQSLIVRTKDLYDEIIINISHENSVEFLGANTNLIDSQNNTVATAIKIFEEYTNQNIQATISVHKNIPIAAGLGGGSANGAEVLRALFELYDITITDSELNLLAQKIGTDASICIYNKNGLVTDVGTHFQSMPLPRMHLLLVNPGIQISSAAIYKNMREKTQFTEEISDLHNVCNIDFLKEMKNDLYSHSLKMHPELKNVIQIIQEQDGCHISRMSGSGSTCFGIFETENLARIAGEKIKMQHGRWWVKYSSTID